MTIYIFTCIMTLKFKEKKKKKKSFYLKALKICTLKF